jgi:hypothetical protein
VGLFCRNWLVPGLVAAGAIDWESMGPLCVGSSCRGSHGVWVLPTLRQWGQLDVWVAEGDIILLKRLCGVLGVFASKWIGYVHMALFFAHIWGAHIDLGLFWLETGEGESCIQAG